MSDAPAYLIIDTESVPDGDLLAKVKYPGEALDAQAAIARAQAEAVAASASGSDFLPVTFHIPVACCVIRVGNDLSLQRITCLGGPAFRPRTIVEQFWDGVARCRKEYRDVRLVTFNGRGFDLPLLELAAFRFGLPIREHIANRKRYDSYHLDLMDWLTNYGAYRLIGGLNLLSKILGKPGKMDVQGDMVYRLHEQGKLQEINDYCTFDTLDTYFVFLRTRVLMGELSIDEEQALVKRAKEWLTAKSAETPAITQYLANWGE